MLPVNDTLSKAQRAPRHSVLPFALLVWLLALAVRLAYVMQIQGTPLTDVLLIDSATYDRFARLILAGEFHGEQVYAMNVLYPWFLALVYALGGGSAFWVPAVQALLGACNVLFIFELGRRIFGLPTGLAAGFLAAFCAPLVFFTGALLTPTLINFFSLLCLLLLTIHEEQRGGGAAGGAGLCLGLAGLGRGSNLLFAPLALLQLRVATGSWERTRRPALFFLAGVAVLVGGVVARNALVEGRFVPVAANYAAFYIGHNERATGLYVLPDFAGTAAFEGEVLGAQEEVSRRLGRPASLAETSQFLFREGLRHARDNPLATLRVTGRKILYFWNGTESPTNLNFYFAEDYSSLLRRLPIRFGMLAPLGLLGMILARRAWRRTLHLLLFMGVQLATCAAFFVSAEYRLPAVPVLLVFGGYAAATVPTAAWAWARGRTQGRGVVLTALLVLPFLFLATGYKDDLLRRQGLKRVDYYNFGVLYRERGDEERAEALFRRALTIDPRFGPAYEGLAGIEDGRGNTAESVRLLELARRFRAGSQYGGEPAAPVGDELLREEALRLYRNRSYSEALVAFRELEEYYEGTGEEGALVSTRNNIGLCLYKMGETAHAIEIFRAILTGEPGYVRARTNLARALEAEGRTSEALLHYREALLQEPRNRSAREGLARLGTGEP
jgi:tetratricopeptide (TPR) repeat protein